MFRYRTKSLMVAALLYTGTGPVASAATTTSLLLPDAAALSVLGTSCGGIQQQAFATGFNQNGYISSEIYLQTRCGGSGRGGSYDSHPYSAWVAVTFDLKGIVLDLHVLASAPIDYNPVFSAFDSNKNKIYNELTAVNVQPAKCTLGNTAYCQYRAYLVTP